MNPPQRSALLSRIDTLYDAGAVHRLHTVPTVRGNTVAEHVYGSLLVATELVELNRQQAAASMLSLSYDAVVRALLIHDAPEVETGDCPSPIKQDDALRAVYVRLEEDFYQAMGLRWPELNEFEADIVKAADLMDLLYVCLRERMMGNGHPRLTQVYDNTLNALADTRYLSGVAELADHVDEVWRSAND